MVDRRLLDTRLFLRFLVAGGTGFGLYLGFALLLRHTTDLPASVVAWLAVLAAVLPTFLIQRLFTFKSGGRLVPQLAGYALLQLASALVVAGAAYLGELMGLHDMVGFVVAGLAGVAFSYLIQTRMIFPA